MKRKLLLLLMILPVAGQAQKQLTLRECYERAYAAAPISGEKETYKNIWELREKNLSKGWYPAIDAGGSFVYNSSVVDMSDILGELPVPGIGDLINPLPHEQYKVTLDINQVIYDGGAIKGSKSLEKAELGINEKQVEADLYKIRGQVNSYFFNSLLLDRQKELLQNYLDLVNKRIVSVNSALSSGVALKSDLDVIQSEKLRLEQQLKENEIRKESLLKLLSGLTGSQIDSSTVFVIPGTGSQLPVELNRPELQIFDLRKEQLDASIKVIQSRKMPRAFGFATLGYGNPPGSNFFRDEFAPYYILGAGVKWNIIDWNKARDDRQVVSLRQNILESRKSDMTDNLNRMLDAKKAEISTLESLIATDEALIGLRKRITVAAASQYENGTITATEYMNELNSEKQAVINFELHRVSLAMARIEYLNISGNEIE